jgi:hypothetical protein
MFDFEKEDCARIRDLVLPSFENAAERLAASAA